MKSSELPTSSLVTSARALNCTRGHIGICAIVLMFIMSTVVWKQRDLVAVRLPSFEHRIPNTLDSNKTTSSNGTLDRFWSVNREYMKDLSHWEKPADISKIMGLVFYGRRQSVSILDCYLKVCLGHALPCNNEVTFAAQPCEERWLAGWSHLCGTN
jgi:hypothetical protein